MIIIIFIEVALIIMAIVAIAMMTSSDKFSLVKFWYEKNVVL